MKNVRKAMNQKLGWIGLFLALLMVCGIVLPSYLKAESPGKAVGAATHPVLIPVLCYHRIIPNGPSVYDFSPAQLEQHFQYLKEHGYHPITALQMLQAEHDPARLPARPVVLTFDDGHRSHYTTVFPLLKKYGYQATFFVIAGSVATRSENAITWAELEEMAQAGMDIECHSMTHPFLTDRRAAGGTEHYRKWLEHEIRDSKLLIEEKLHRPVRLLAYPYGWFNQTVEEVALQAGYQGMHTVFWGNNESGDSPLRIKRRVMENSYDLAKLERILTIRPLHLQIYGPADAAIVTQIPAIRFKLSIQDRGQGSGQAQGVKDIELQVRNYRVSLEPDGQGVYTFQPPELKPGYCMITVKGSDAAGNLYETSWGFDYRKHDPADAQRGL